MKSSLDKYIKPWIRDIETYIPGKTLEGCIKLASNENNYGPSPKVMDAIENAKPTVNVYPYRYEEVREKVAGYCRVEPGNIVLGNGSDEIMDFILKTFQGPCLGFNPTFSLYNIYTKILGGEYREINLGRDFTFPTEQFIVESKKANLLFLCNPNNPTGTVIPEDDLRGVLDGGRITVVDEAYYEFYGKTAIPLLKDYDNLIILRTFAKAFALAGLRLGYGITNPEIVDLLCRVKPPFNVNSIAQAAALSTLDDLPYMKSTVDRIVKDRGILYRKLNQRFKTFKSNANFILVDTTPTKSTELYDRLLEKKIVVRNLGRFRGFEGEYCRISVGTSEENRKLIEALEEFQ